MAIQISMAPAFLLVAISNLINGITATRQRIIDRYRELSAENSDVLIPTDEVEYEKSVLRHRVSLSTRAITLLTSATMLIALVIFIIFISLVSPEIDLTLTLAPLVRFGDVECDRGQCVFSSAVACVIPAAAPHWPFGLSLQSARMWAMAILRSALVRGSWGRLKK